MINMNMNAKVRSAAICMDSLPNIWADVFMKACGLVKIPLFPIRKVFAMMF